MQYFLSKGFRKQFAKLPKRTKEKALEQLQIFVADPKEYRLRNHPLTGEWRGYRSIDIVGDIRAVYKEIDADIVRFDAVGSHSELYE